MIWAAVAPVPYAKGAAASARTPAETSRNHTWSNRRAAIASGSAVAAVATANA